MAVVRPSRPTSRHGFEIAVICALTLEADAVEALFDIYWDENGPPFDKARGDPNAYTTGAIGRHYVVLAHMPGMGKASAAVVASNCRMSFPNIKLALVVGVCGVVPFPFGSSNGEIVLGDVVVSDGVIQYDFGRRLPDRLQRKDTLLDTLGRPNLEIRGLMTKLKGLRGRKQLSIAIAKYLGDLQQEPDLRATYPGIIHDRLFEATYRHIGDKETCEQVCCNGSLVQRQRLRTSQKALQPTVHFGMIASGDSVIKSGEDRDVIAAKEGVIAFEMESAGVWDIFPCVVIKGACDYADSHKSKRWHRYAAATAAACMKAFLGNWVPSLSIQPAGQNVQNITYLIPYTSNPELLNRSEVAAVGPHAGERNARHWIVPFDRNKNFVGRESILAKLLEMIPPSANRDACQQTAIEGLGGVGKTQIALEAAFRIREKYQDCSVFWVPAVDAATFESAYRDIGRHLKVQGVEEDKADVKWLIKRVLSRIAHSWLLIIDNADDVDQLLSSITASPLFDYLPSSHNGSILFTTRNAAVVRGLDVPRSNVVRITKMSRPEAEQLLQRNLDPSQSEDSECTTQLLDFLADLPLAIKQASAYISKTGMTVRKYLSYCQSSSKRLVELLSKDFADRGRYKTAQNAITTTWLISFGHISRDHSQAAHYLKFMSFLAEKDIPKSLLPAGDELEAEEAIGNLLSYAFISKRPDQDSYDMHQLVSLAMQNWLTAKREPLLALVTTVIQRLDEAFPFPDHKNRTIWVRCLPHAQKALAFRDKSKDKLAVSRLLFNVAESNLILGKYAEAETMFKETLAVRAKVLGARHPDTLKSRSSLATTLRIQGMYHKAEAMHQETLVLQTKVLGAGHPNTLRTMNDFANALSSQGKYAKAEAVYEDTILVQTKELGAEHLDTLRSKNNLANVLCIYGRYAEAEATYRETLVLAIKELGPEHPDTLIINNNLALILSCQGNYAEAENMHRETLVVQTKVLGAEHPDTLRSKNSLTTTLHNQGRYAEAGAAYRETLVLQTKLLGAEHPDTLESRNSLTSALCNQGKYAEAEAIYWEMLMMDTKILGTKHFDMGINSLRGVLRLQEKNDDVNVVYREILVRMTKALGAEHPATLKTRSHLASKVQERRIGGYAETEAIYRKTAMLQTKVLGAEHPDTLESRNSLASALCNQGEYAEAEAIYRQTVMLQTTALGAEHPDTLKSRNSLASALCDQRKYAEAEAIYWEMLMTDTEGLGTEYFDMSINGLGDTVNLRSSAGIVPDYREILVQVTKTLGAEHPTTLKTMYRLASKAHERGSYDEAEAVYRETIMLQTKVQGSGHPDTLKSRNSLASALCDQRKYAEAEVIYWEMLMMDTKILGTEHFAMSINGLRHVVNRQSSAGVVADYEEIIVRVTKALGAEHPTTLKTRNSLARALCEMGKYAESEAISRVAIVLATKTLGADHPDTLKSRDRLASTVKLAAEAVNPCRFLSYPRAPRPYVDKSFKPSKIYQGSKISQTVLTNK